MKTIQENLREACIEYKGVPYCEHAILLMEQAADEIDALKMVICRIVASDIYNGPRLMKPEN